MRGISGGNVVIGALALVSCPRKAKKNNRSQEGKVRVTMVERLTARVVSQLAFEGEEG